MSSGAGHGTLARGHTASEWRAEEKGREAGLAPWQAAGISVQEAALRSTGAWNPMVNQNAIFSEPFQKHVQHFLA